MNEAAKQYLSEIGKRGGASKSDAKRNAAAANLVKAREARNAKREQNQQIQPNVSK